MTTIATFRRFRVHVGHTDRHHAVFVEEASFEAAVVAFVEDHPAMAEADDEVRLIVHDVASGHEHCFRVDLSTGETSSCG
jgi:hypothetical protein